MIRWQSLVPWFAETGARSVVSSFRMIASCFELEKTGASAESAPVRSSLAQCILDWTLGMDSQLRYSDWRWALGVTQQAERYGRATAGVATMLVDGKHLALEPVDPGTPQLPLADSVLDICPQRESVKYSYQAALETSPCVPSVNGSSKRQRTSIANESSSNCSRRGSCFTPVLVDATQWSTAHPIDRTTLSRGLMDSDSRRCLTARTEFLSDNCES